MSRVLPSITTHGTPESTWRSKLAEVRELELRRIGLFVTGLSSNERTECFSRLHDLLKEHHFEIPFVHAVSSMTDDEFRMLSDRFGTRAFNLHPVKQYPLQHHLSKQVREQIFIENADSRTPLNHEDLEGFAGLCIDISHLEEARLLQPEGYESVIHLTKHARVGANHISAITLAPTIGRDGREHYSSHIARDASELSYLSSYSSEFYSPYCALELENSLKQQIELQAFVERALSHTYRAAAA